MSIEITNWKALKDMECPKCGCRLIKNQVGYGCCACDFKIREEKFNNIINSMSLVKPRSRVVEDDYERNLSDLNNL